MKTSTTELKKFVIDQAAEDAALPSGERRHQEQLVTDVLKQEAPSTRALNELIALYHTEKQAA